MNIEKDKALHEEGLILRCNQKGNISDVIYNGLETLDITDSGKSFFNIIGEGSVHKANNFLKEIFTRNQSFNWELNVHLKNEIFPLRFSGINTGSNCIIVAAKSNYEMSSLVDYFIEQVSNEDMELKESLQNLQLVSCKQEQRDRDLIDEITRLNNELVTVQRELSKKNSKLNQLNNDLEKRVDERTKKIKRLLQQKDDFVVQLGHDLKTPLGPIINLVPIIEQKEQDPKLKEKLRIVNRSSKKLRNLIVKIMKYAYVTSRHFSPKYENISVQLTINDVIKQKKEELHEKNIMINNIVSDKIYITSDRSLLSNVFEELISNSIKYSQNDAVIEINCIENNESYTFSVVDTGIGLTQKQIDHVFDEFYKCDESRHDLYSHGLGLSISKNVIEQLGGTMWAESEGIGQGSSFYFTIPVKLENTQKNAEIRS